MSFSVISGSPTFGTDRSTITIGEGNLDPVNKVGIAATNVQQAVLGVIGFAGLDTSGLGDNSGWQFTFIGGRPTNGLIYPRRS